MLERSRTRKPFRRAILAAMAVAAGGVLAVLPMTPADATAVTYHDRFLPNNFHTLNMKLLNDTDEPITAWRIDFDLPAGTWPGFWISAEYTVKTTAFTDRDNHVTITPPSRAPDGGAPPPLQPGGAIFINLLMHGNGTLSNCLVDGTDPCVQVTP